MKGYIRFQDKGKKRAGITISDVPDLAALSSFVQSFQSFSNAKIISFGVMLNEIYANGQLQTGTFDSVEDKARFTFMDYSDINNPKAISMSLPAPDDDVLEFVNGIGRRIKNSMGDAIAMMLKTLTGKELVFSKGHFRAARTDPQI